MRLPSVNELVVGARSVLRRFPTVLAGALASTVAGLVLAGGPDPDVWERLMAVATLSLPLFFAFTLLAERRGWSRSREGLLHAGGLVVLAAVFAAWSGWSDGVAARRYVQLSAGFHLVAAFLPFVGVREHNGFWQYNRSLFLRFLTAALYAAVLYFGLALALAALDHLFGLPVSGEAYLRLWIVMALLFHPWFFLAGVPEDLAALDAVTDYPRGLELFTRYVLVPLVAVYLAILTAYAAKVVFTWDWPSGWIGWLVSGVSVTGILALLLVHPVRGRDRNTWVRAYGRWFWVALMPSVVLLLLAIWQRIAQYGVTEDRYFLLVLALWLAAMAVFYAVRRSENLQLVPRSLAAVALITFAGPWSAYAVSERSQRGRLESLLARNELVVDGEIRPSGEPVPFDDRREISATIRYLLERHGAGAVAPAFGGELPIDPSADETAGADTPAGEPGPTPEAVVSALGLEYVDRWQRPSGGGYLSFTGDGSGAARSVAGFGHVVRDVASHGSDTVRVTPGLRLTAGDTLLQILREDRSPLTLSVIELGRRLGAAGYGRGRPVPPGEMWFEVADRELRAALWLRYLHARRTDGGELEDVRWSGDVYVGGAASGGAGSPGAASDTVRAGRDGS